MNVTDPEYRIGLAHFLEGLKGAAAEGLFNPDPELNIGAFKRTLRTVLSQGNTNFAEAFTGMDPKQLLDPAFAKKQAAILSKISDEAQRHMNYAPGVVEGHHPISVSSIEAASRHLPLEDRLEFLQVLNNEYQVGGTNGWGQFGLSKFAHQGFGTRASKPFPEMNAHFTSDPSTMVEEGFKVDTGTWQHEDFSSIKDPRKLAQEFYNRSGEPQMRFAEIAYDQPQEVQFRKLLADQLGIRPRDLDAVGTKVTDKGKPISNANWIRDQIKAKGIDVEGLMYQAYGIERPAPKPTTPRASTPRGPKKPIVKPDLDALKATGMFDVDFVNEDAARLKAAQVAASQYGIPVEELAPTPRNFTTARRAQALQRANALRIKEKSSKDSYGTYTDRWVSDHASGVIGNRNSAVGKTGKGIHEIQFSNSPMRGVGDLTGKQTNQWGSRTELGLRPQSREKSRLRIAALKDMMGDLLDVPIGDEVTAAPTTPNRGSLYYRNTGGALGVPHGNTVISTRISEDEWLNHVTGKTVKFNPKSLKEALAAIASEGDVPTSYNAGLPGFGKKLGQLIKNNVGGTVGGLGTGLMFDKDLHSAVSNKDPLKVATHLGTDAVMGAGTQAAVRVLPVAAGAKVAAAMNPVGAVMMAAAAPSSTDQGKQRERLMKHVNKLPPAKKNAAIKQIKADDKAAAKPLIDGNALLKKGINEGKWFLKQLGIKF
jgi:hypothetical protein